jgi:acetyl esterase/lipase
MSLRRMRLMRFVDALIHLWVARGTESRNVPGHADNPVVPVVMIDHRFDRSKATPAILHIHGGGYIMGRPGLQVPTLKRVSAELNCLVVSVEYRLAPEAPFPGSLEDNYAALRWLHGNAAELGVDPARIALLGESAGGGHAAALAIAARDRGTYPLCLQVLIYPMLDDRTARFTGPEWCGHFVWNSHSNRFGWRALLGCEPGTESVPVGAVPARAESLNGLPPTWIGVGDLDLFHDENLAYARRLELAGVATELYTQAGAYHGFDLLAGQATVAQAFTRSWIEALARAFAP